MVEKILRWFDSIHGLRSISLRYFNASGAETGGNFGEEHEPETHLIPLLLRAVKTGAPMTIFGDDYPTPDGTCIRDVLDLAEAHIVALESLLSGGPSDHFNVGTGVGHSIREVIATVEEVTGKKVPYVIGPRAKEIRRPWWQIPANCSGLWGGSLEMPICAALSPMPGNSKNTAWV
jgi:UDP-glucose 4-epimerase